MSERLPKRDGERQGCVEHCSADSSLCRDSMAVPCTIPVLALLLPGTRTLEAEAPPWRWAEMGNFLIISGREGQGPRHFSLNVVLKGSSEHVIIYVCITSVCVHVSHHAHVEFKGKFAGICSLPSTTWIPGLELRLSGLVTSVFVCLAILPACNGIILTGV